MFSLSILYYWLYVLYRINTATLKRKLQDLCVDLFIKLLGCRSGDFMFGIGPSAGKRKKEQCCNDGR